MSEFRDRIRAARVSARPPDALVAATHLAEVPPPQPAEPRPDLPERRRHGRELAVAVSALEAQRRRLEELSRKVDELNAALLTEILRRPRGAEHYPRTVALLAGGLAGRVTAGAGGRGAPAQDEDQLKTG